MDKQDTAYALYTQTNAAKTLLAQYQTILGEDAEAKADLVEGQTSLNEAIEQAVARTVEIDALEASLKDVIGNAQKRLKRLQDQRELLRTGIATAMEIAGKKRVETAIATVSLRPVPPKVEITDETLVPTQFWRRADPALDRRAILEALKAKQDVPGALLSNGGSAITVLKA